MEQTGCKLTVFFEGPFWVGVYERHEDGKISACKITFGAEPRDAEVWQMILCGFHRLHFPPGVADAGLPMRTPSPKRAQRLARQEQLRTGIGTKAQQALALQREAGKEARRKRSRREKEQEQQRQFELRQEKRREKHRGH